MAGRRIAAASGVLALGAIAAAITFTGAAGASTTGGYGGLGSTVRAFYAQNTHGSGMPPVGLVNFQVDATKNGKVTAYHVIINARPAWSARDRVAFMDGINLPIDATETNLNGSHCLVWHSKKLGKLIGMSYAAATTGSDNTTASMRAESKPHC